MDNVVAPSGRWQGESLGGVAVFRGIPYARAERFGAPEPVAPQDGVCDATRRYAIAPQLPGRLENVMGRADLLDQSEDCLALTVTAPEDVELGSCPVLVWLHGGAYLAGSGQWNLYDADQLVRETRIVVVSVSYRLGALGYLRAPGVSAGNLGLRDQLAALRWVRAHIAEFGGDPERITVSGQSAGAQSVVALLGIAEARPLFAQAIVQSAPFGIGFQSHRHAERVGAMFLAELDADPFTAAVPELLAAQGRTVRRMAGPGALNSAPPFLPVADADPIPDERTWRQAVHDAAADLRVVLGCTAEEARAFYGGPHPVFGKVRRLPLVGERTTSAVQRLIGRKAFEDGLFRFADELTDAGATVYSYRVGQLHPANPYGACHCIDLPLLYGSGSTWATSPMLVPLVPPEIDALGVRTRRYWGEFVHTGEVGDTTWRPHRRGSRFAQQLP
ncbi:carboxylesterase family protein [Nocardia sp. NBC_00508]|uniref:carboxylesterase family protein n=1 Tax=Nocardia sp. NBC_00508 TaxID=2975992 RepID=UPI002E814D61|nr:carboxylesterase family protein [Nocardia sp. NBC_00508]WUD68933.1 carboxylesterase family protein [Nocardia sp. NBC_00508]